MVINTSGGNKAKKQKRSIKYESTDKLDEGQLFGIILDKCGGCHFRLMCSDGRSRNGKLSGRMANGPRVNTGSYVIISLRDFEKDQKNCDIIGHGSPSVDVIKILKNNNSNTKQKDDINFKDSDDEFEDFNIKENDNNDTNDADANGCGDITFTGNEGTDDDHDGDTSDGDHDDAKGTFGTNSDVWNDDDTQSNKIITKDEIDDLIDLL
jgi:initiation factor 1A